MKNESIKSYLETKIIEQKNNSDHKASINIWNLNHTKSFNEITACLATLSGHIH